MSSQLAWFGIIVVLQLWCVWNFVQDEREPQWRWRGMWALDVLFCYALVMLNGRIV